MTASSPFDLKQLLSHAQLPALPQSAVQLLELSRDPENGPAEFTVPIEADPGLTSQVLRFVNSSYFGFSREIASVKLAITLVGGRTIKNFALWSAVFSVMPNPRCSSFSLTVLWQDSLQRALFARMLGKRLRIRDVEELFSAALLQDVAIPLLAKNLPDEYETMLTARSSRTPRRLSQMEEERFGWTHGDAAAVVGEAWSFPESFGNLVRHHADPGVWTEDAPLSVLAVNLSSLLPSILDEQWTDFPKFVEGCRVLLGAGETEIEQILWETDKAFHEFAPLLSVPASAESLVQRMQFPLAT